MADLMINPDFCYRDVPLDVGDARIAFVLGHELAHLAKDDFWHLAAFDSIQRFGRDPDRSRQTLNLLKKTADLGNTSHSRDIARRKEMQADAYGLLYSSMAGYDPKCIVDEKGHNFIKAWGNQIARVIPENDGIHPDPGLRADFLLTNIRSVRNDLDLFHLGVRLYQIGRYRDALDFFSAFHEKFPSREVFNNIGLIHYRIAMEQLTLRDPGKTVRFNLSTMVDMKTRADQYRGGYGGSLFGKALRHFRAACERDPTYLPARVNHASALIMAKRYSEALAVLDEAMKLQKGAPSLLNNRAVAVYLLGPSIGTDMYRQAVALLKKIIEENPDFPPAHFNLARLQAERERNSNARKTWNRYLEIQPNGPYADAARKILGMKKTRAGSEKICTPDFIPPPPVMPGNLDQAGIKLFKGLARHQLDPVTAYGDYYSGENTLVLVLEDVVELVEQKVNLETGEKLLSLGRPNRVLAGSSKTRSYVYDNFVIDVEGDRITGIVHFAKGYD
ncbi:MAG: tetratricopeptide repeat protein [Desulfobacteraceae bacterium]|nr:tetratricopeptide repeat protein [Desulfobacteraceae bacterium]